jgi:hypothetical protein
MNPFENTQLAGVTMASPDSNTVIISDSSNPTGDDLDIGTPNPIYGGPRIGDGGASNDTALGNVLILSEDLDASDPDDIFEVGANDAVILNAFDIFDVAASSNPSIVHLYDFEENILFSKEVSSGGDNSKTTVDLENTSGLAFMEIIMKRSGAIDNIAFELETEEPCIECDSNIVELTFKYIGGSQQVPVRIETPEGDVIFGCTVQIDEEFTATGNASDGTFGSEIIVFIENEQITILAAGCSEPIGPGFLLLNLDIVSGITQTRGQLCLVEVQAF